VFTSVEGIPSKSLPQAAKFMDLPLCLLDSVWWLQSAVDW